MITLGTTNYYNLDCAISTFYRSCRTFDFIEAISTALNKAMDDSLGVPTSVLIKAEQDAFYDPSERTLLGRFKD